MEQFIKKAVLVLREIKSEVVFNCILSSRFLVGVCAVGNVITVQQTGLKYGSESTWLALHGSSLSLIF